MSLYPAFLEIVTEGEPAHFFKYDRSNPAHCAEARRQAAAALAVWLDDWQHVLPSAEIKPDTLSRLIGQLSAKSRSS